MRFLFFTFSILFSHSIVLSAAPCDPKAPLIIKRTGADWSEFTLDKKCRYHGAFKVVKNHRVSETGTYSAGLLDGRRKVFRRDGSVFEVFDYRQGLAHGLKEQYYQVPVGAVKQRIRFQNGLKNGLTETFNPTGRLISSVSFKKGVVDGVSSELENPYALSNFKEVSSIYNRGLLVSEKIKSSWKEVSDLSTSEFDAYSMLKLESRTVLGSFRMRDLIGRKRLTILLPSDICRPEIRKVDLASLENNKWKHFKGEKRKQSVCLSLLKISNLETRYRLYDRFGYLKEKGSLVNWNRDGFVTFYRLGRPVYFRKYYSGEPAPEVFYQELNRKKFLAVLDETKSNGKELSVSQSVRAGKSPRNSKTRISQSKSRCALAENQETCFKMLELEAKKKTSGSDSVSILKALCYENSRSKCSEYSSNLKKQGRYEEARSALEFGCERGDESSCYKVGEDMRRSGYIEKAIGFWKKSCLRGSSKTVLTKEAMIQSRSCRAVAYHYRGISDVEKSQEFLCHSEQKMNPGAKCSALKVLGDVQNKKDVRSL